jgi:branched-chain amino acid aminotransferase
MVGIYASIDGRVVPGERARVSVFDNGFTFGDSVYETLRTYGGRPFALDRHLRRLRASADRIGIQIPLPDATLGERLEALLEAAANDEAYVRFIVTRGVGDISYRFDRIVGPSVVLIVKPFEGLPREAYAEGIAAWVVSVRRNHEAALDPAIKSCNLLNNVLAVREAQARGAVEALMLNAAGDLAEGASSNVFLVKRGRVSTPPLEAGILAGITREVVLELLPDLGIEARETRLGVEDLRAADEVFITSSLREVAPVRAVDGRPVGEGRPGPVTTAVLSAYRDGVGRYLR